MAGSPGSFPAPPETVVPEGEPGGLMGVPYRKDMVFRAQPGCRPYGLFRLLAEVQGIQPVVTGAVVAGICLPSRKGEELLLHGLVVLQPRMCRQGICSQFLFKLAERYERVLPRKIPVPVKAADLTSGNDLKDDVRPDRAVILTAVPCRRGRVPCPICHGAVEVKVSIPYCVWRSTNLFLSLSVLHILRKQKSAKRLPCPCMVSSDTTYNHKQRMPRFSIKEPEPAGCSGGCGHIGYVLPVPVPRIQVSHKNQLRLYLNTISCIMST